MSALLLIGALYTVQVIADSDFIQDYAAARGWRQGLDPNAHTAYLLAMCCPGIRVNPSITQTAHPPLATLLAIPFSLLPWTLARHAWLVVGWTAIVWSWHVQRIKWPTCAATMGFWLMGLGLGALEPLLFALLAAALLIEERAPRRAGILLGIGVALKIYPIILLVGLLIRGKRQVFAAAVVACLLAMLVAELVLGYGATQAWLTYQPINTLKQANVAGNNSLVRVIRTFIPDASPILLAVILSVLLITPLIPLLRRGDGVRPILSVMLLVSPVSWGHYLGLLTLEDMNHFEEVVLLICGTLIFVTWIGLVPSQNLAPVGYGPLLLVLLLMWYRQVRLLFRQNQHSIISSTPPFQQGEE